MPETRSTIVFDSGAEPHAQDLYRYDDIAPSIDRLDQIGPEQLEQFRREGYIAVNNALDAATVEAGRAGLSDMIQQKIDGKFQLMFEASVRDRLEELSPEQRESSIRKVFQFSNVDKRLDDIAFNPELISVLERLGCTKPQLFQSMALLKGPNGREKPWHQDRAYFQYEFDKPIIGIWIALDEATPENGCMHIIPGEHTRPFIHFHRRDWQICDTDIQSLDRPRLAVPLKPGGMLLFDSMLPHGTPRNASNKRRRALQYHYMPEGLGISTKEARMAMFGADGKNVEC